MGARERERATGQSGRRFDAPADEVLSAPNPRIVLQLQVSAGNAAVARTLREGDGAPAGQLAVLRCATPGAPPKRPMPTGRRKKGGGAGPKTFAEMYVAIQSLDWGDDIFETIRPEDLAQLDKSQLRTLESLVVRMGERCAEIAQAQAQDPAYRPPEGLPDVVYSVVVGDLATLKAEIEVRRPWATLSALVAFGHLRETSPGASSRTKALWALSEAKVREMLWREELGSVDPRGGTSSTDAFSDGEVLMYGYVTGGNWDPLLNPNSGGTWQRICEGPPLNRDGTISEAGIVSAMRAQRTLVPLDIARFLTLNAETSTAEELAAKLSGELTSIDASITDTLQTIYTSKQHGDAFEGPFLAWMKGAGEGSVYALYKEFAEFSK